VIWNDYVFSNRLKVTKEVCKELRVGQKKDGFTFAEVAKKLLKESKERPNDPISKRGLDANMQKLEDAQEELKQKMEAEEAVEQFNSLPPEQQVAIMQQEGEKAQNAVAQEQMAQEIQNLPPEQQQAIAQQMMAQQAAAQG
jgi:DNA-directed RNA polymerase specialized sigma24 family protein